MGGIGSGGTRPGAGKKPSGEIDWSTPPEPVEMPGYLTEEAQVVWQSNAPHALEARTLVPATAESFAEFCETVVRARTLWKRIEKDGLTFLKVSVDGAGVEHQEPKKHPLLAEHRGLMVRIETGRQRFKLAPIGKPIQGKKKDGEQSALERLKAESRIRAVG